MKIFLNKKKLVDLIHREKNLGFVPTMGAIHEGHMSLIKRANLECNKTIVSIFINKPQFNKKDDYKFYPRILNKDIYLLKKMKVDFLYLPKNKEIYPYGINRNIRISPFRKKLCGKYRPGHFEAIADVIERFVNIIKPNKIYMGEKDMQQLKIIKNYISKKYKKIKVIGCKTIREKSGLAISSRNLLMSKNDKKIASKVYQILSLNKKSIINKKISLLHIKNEIYNLGIKKIEYLKVLDINKLVKPYKKNKKYKIFISYFMKSVRLIDNI
tara:strand:- start:33 stop:842 length:810 start_codon:yes stop_codon:yes gene_type:complete